SFCYSLFFFSSRRRHTRWPRDWSSDVCSSDLRVFTRSQLLERVWGSDFYDDHVVEVHVGNLRRKLEDDPARPRWVQTVRGVGYRSEERRVGKECRSRWAAEHEEKKEMR